MHGWVSDEIRVSPSMSIPLAGVQKRGIFVIADQMISNDRLSVVRLKCSFLTIKKAL